jgi:hypothetical protein
MKKKKLISLEEKDLKRIEEIQQNNNLNFSNTIKFLLDNYDNRLTKHIARSNENIEILNLYITIYKTNKIDKNKLKSLMKFLYENEELVTSLKVEIFKEKKNNKK